MGMTPAAFKAARKHLGHSQRTLADALKNNIRTVQRMEAGQGVITPKTALHIQLMLSVRAQQGDEGDEG